MVCGKYPGKIRKIREIRAIAYSVLMPVIPAFAGIQ